MIILKWYIIIITVINLVMNLIGVVVSQTLERRLYNVLSLVVTSPILVYVILK